MRKRDVVGMNIVLYTQRVEIVKSYGERRDCVDQNIARFLMACGFIPVPVPNIKELALNMLKALNPTGIVFTGGNSLEKYGGDAPERDETERTMLGYAIEHGIPVYGFCRGMQMILDYFGCELSEVSGHVAVRHEIQGAMGTMDVNSFHNQGCLQSTTAIEVLAKTSDGVIEAAAVKGQKIMTTMWHPEREVPFKEQDIQFVQRLFSEE